MVPPAVAQVPSHIPPELARDVDLVNDPAVLADPYAAFDRLRDEGDILWSSQLGGHWILLGSQQVREAYQSPDLFSNYPAGVPPLNEFWPRKLIPQELDGDEHLRYRRLLSPFFKPSAIRPMADSVRNRARKLIAEVIGKSEVDFVRAVAVPLPSSVFLDLFGLPLDKADVFTEWTQELLHSGDAQRSGQAGAAAVAYLLELIAERRRDPRDDLISVLAATGIDGIPLTTEEVLDTAFLLFIAGLDTVTNQLSVIFHHLARDRHLQNELRACSEKIPVALEECLRVYPIVPPARTLTRDHVFHGVAMKSGDTVLLASSAASRDPRAFDHADTVDLDRGGNWTTAFGLGPHRCLGAHLARQELTIVLQLMLEMLPPFELPPDFQPTWYTAGNVWGIASLPLRFVS
jgi:cytochrome P450